MVNISIHNSGNVIKTDELESIFGFFQRAKNAEELPYQGWGIGLTLVQGLARSPGGDVVAKSSIEEGTTFTISVPQDSRNFTV